MPCTNSQIHMAPDAFHAARADRTAEQVRSPAWAATPSIMVVALLRLAGKGRRRGRRPFLGRIAAAENACLGCSFKKPPPKKGGQLHGNCVPGYALGPSAGCCSELVWQQPCHPGDVVMQGPSHASPSQQRCSVGGCTRLGFTNTANAECWLAGGCVQKQMHRTVSTRMLSSDGN